MNANTILQLLSEVKKADASGEGRLPQNSFYLDKDRIVCKARDVGESRYPYEFDGLTVWLRSGGFIDAQESNFNIFKTANYGEESAVNFFAGLPDGTGEYTPISITGSSRQAKENGVCRYIVYTPQCAYCIAETKHLVFALRLHVDEHKHIRFSLHAVNTSTETQDCYLASFLEAILRYAENEIFWDRLKKYGFCDENRALLVSKNKDSYDCLSISHRVICGTVTEQFRTCSRGDFLGSKGLSVANARSLREGRFSRRVSAVNTTDLPVAANLFCFSLRAGESARVEYDVVLLHETERPNGVLCPKMPIDVTKIDTELAERAARERANFDRWQISFSDFSSEKMSAELFSSFLRSVQKQVTICAHGKNYAGAFIGVRDVFQQLEGSLVWQPETAREKILSAMNYVLVTGRPPRQFSLPVSPDAPVLADLRKFIDQGVWIISTIYTYLSFTDDVSVLSEECGYIEAPENLKLGDAARSPQRDSVLCHMKKIMAYLLSNLDPETGCLYALYGDWNDALDGLGAAEDARAEFGTGVTVMATLQLYQNLREMQEILTHIKDTEADSLCPLYAEAAAKIAKGLQKYAIDRDGDGNRRIIHGWGDRISYKVGSFCDPDGAARYSLTANSFWAITKFLQTDPTLKSTILDCMDAVSSKYGLKTFDVSFPPNTPGVGRIATLLPGTYENSCAYVHASMFAIMALFEMGESKRAWEEIEKSIVITHENCTLSTFVMPNSYCENAEYSMDGDSMGDWHTGSGSVLLKTMIRYAFGIYPTPSGVRIQFPRYFPAKQGQMQVTIKGSDVMVTYENRGVGSRSVEISGADGVTETEDALMGIRTYFLPKENMGKIVRICVAD